MTQKLKGILSPVVTPFDEELRPDKKRWLAHCRWLLSQDCGLAIFGTNSEANSLSVTERLSLLNAAAEVGLNPQRMMPGTGACALPDAVELTKAAVQANCAGVLMLPPFYYKDVTDDGIFEFFSEVIQRVGDERLRMYLYHIPPISHVPISQELIARLLKEYPSTIAGIKDSSGNWENTRAMIERFDNFDVFAGSEQFLLRTLRAGGAGCISATANINPAAIHDLYATWQASDADARQEAITAFRLEIANFPMIPALKAAIGLHTDDLDWERVRPPQMRLNAVQVAELAATLERFRFNMSGRREA